jgi:hypothetical protein
MSIDIKELYTFLKVIVNIKIFIELMYYITFIVIKVYLFY